MHINNLKMSDLMLRIVKVEETQIALFTRWKATTSFRFILMLLWFWGFPLKSASIQIYLRRLSSYYIIHTISFKVQFFLSTILFYWGILGIEKLYLIFFSLQVLSKFWFTNFIPWSLWIDTIKKFFSFGNFVIKLCECWKYFILLS